MARGECYIDLCDESRYQIRVTPAGWQVVPESEIKFLRHPGMASLPRPVSGGDLRDINRYLNLDRDDLLLVLVWLTFVVQRHESYPILIISGVQGSGKTTLTRVLRKLVDPAVAELTDVPRSRRDLAIAASQSHLLALDNLGAVDASLADAMCRVATGGGFRTRRLYTNREEVIFTFRNPQIINGIGDVVSRPDLLDRALLVNMKPIDEKERRDEQQFWSDFRLDQASLFGAMLDAIVAGVGRLESIRIPALPRMADFARWGLAVSEALGFCPEDFEAAYQRNLEKITGTTVEASPVAFVISRFANSQSQKRYSGTMTELLRELNAFIEKKDPRLSSSQPIERRHPSWPKSANLLGIEIRRVQPALAKLGINCECRHTNRGTVIDLSMATASENADDGIGGFVTEELERAQSVAAS